MSATSGGAAGRSSSRSAPWATARAVRELVPADPLLSARWHVHDYPGPFARWNHHVEYEIHLARTGPGRYIVGDTVGLFGAGHLALVGPDVPHDWISDLDPGEVLVGRDVVFQFHPEWISQATALFPELRALAPLWRKSLSGVEFDGATAEAAARELEQIGVTRGADRLARIFSLFHVLNTAPEGESRLISSVWEPREGDPDAQDVVSSALAYVVENLAQEVCLSDAASIAGMSDSTFSRYFKRASGLTFTDMVRKLRLAQAAKLLTESTMPVHVIAGEVGYSNLSNFNRQFRTVYRQTPSSYRAQATRLQAQV